MNTMTWSWKPLPGGGYSGLNGKATLKKKERKWFLTVDGKEHEIKSRRPSFDHAEALLRDLGKTSKENTMNTYSYDRTAGKTLKGSTPFKVEISREDSDPPKSYGTLIVLEGGIGIGKGYERFKATIILKKGKISKVTLSEGSELAKGALWSTEVENYLKTTYG